MSRMLAVVALGILLTSGGAPASAQGYRLRLDSRVQLVGFRGLTADSIPRSAAVRGPNGGFLSPDGFAVDCTAAPLCRFFRPGPERRGAPVVTSADLLLWGLGPPGLTVRVHARHLTDLADDRVWPALAPAVQLIEGYAEYVRGALTARAGRLLLPGRLGIAGADGGFVGMDLGRGLDAALYGGWGLARATALPVTSPALNPLDDFQPRDRQLVAGAELGWRGRPGEVRAEYRREVDPASDYFVSERAAVSATARPVHGLRLHAAADWDLAMGHLGSAESGVTYTHRRGSVSLGARRYRPFFDLWTIWGAFSPVSWEAVHADLSVRPFAVLTLRARGERYRYDPTEADAPLTRTEDDGWRWRFGTAWTPGTRWTGEVNTFGEFGPGASTRGFDGRVTWQPSRHWTVAAEGGWLERPLEFRFSDASVSWLGAEVEARPDDGWRVSLRIARFAEDRARPDAAAFAWDQFRLSARVSLLLRSDADRPWLPPPLGTGR